MSVGPAMGSSGQARLQAKRQELEGLLMLKEQSARLAKDVERLSQGVDQLVDGGEGASFSIQLSFHTESSDTDNAFHPFSGRECHGFMGRRFQSRSDCTR